MALDDFINGQNRNNVNEKIIQIVSADGHVLRLGNLATPDIRKINRMQSKVLLYHNLLKPGALSRKKIAAVNPEEIIDKIHAVKIHTSVSESKAGNLLLDVITPMCQNKFILPNNQQNGNNNGQKI